METELINAELVLPTHFSFKRIQIYKKYPKGQPRGRWKHLKQILQAENYQNFPTDEPNCKNNLRHFLAPSSSFFTLI